MAVSMKPGATAFTVMPREANSLATDFVMAINPTLGGGVVGLTGVAHQPDDRGDVNDASAALFEHRARHGPRTVERPLEVYGDDLIHSRPSCASQVLSRVTPALLTSMSTPAELRYGLFDHRVAFLGVAHVHGNVHGLAARGVISSASALTPSST